MPSIHTNKCLLSRDCSHSSPPQLWYLPEQDRSSDPANVATSLPSRAEQTAHDGIFLFRQPLVCLENSCTHCTNAGVPSPGHWETVYNSLGKLSWSNSGLEVEKLLQRAGNAHEDKLKPLGASASSCRVNSLVSVFNLCQEIHTISQPEK